MSEAKLIVPTRRGFLAGLGALFAAPAIVKVPGIDVIEAVAAEVEGATLVTAGPMLSLYQIIEEMRKRLSDTIDGRSYDGTRIVGLPILDEVTLRLPMKQFSHAVITPAVKQIVSDLNIDWEKSHRQGSIRRHIHGEIYPIMGQPDKVACRFIL